MSDAQISPDGTRVLYTRSDLKNWKDNKRVSSVWLVTSDGKDGHTASVNLTINGSVTRKRLRG